MPTPLDRLDLSRTPWATRSELQALAQEHARELTLDIIQEPPAIPARLIPPGLIYDTTSPETRGIDFRTASWAEARDLLQDPPSQEAVEDPIYRPTLWEHLGVD